MLAPVVVVLGVAPELEAALYFTVVVLILLGAAWLLLALVFSQRPPRALRRPAAPGSSRRLWLSPTVRRMLTAERKARRAPRTGRRDRAEPLAACGRWRDMQDADLLVELAGIAGVFVGFGALISVRSGGPSEAHEVTYIRSVVAFGMLVIIAALAPVTLGRYDLTGHAGLDAEQPPGARRLARPVVVGDRTTEYARRRGGVSGDRSPAMGSRAGLRALVIVPAAGAPIVVVLGLFPDQEPALYFTVVVLGLLGAVALLCWSSRSDAPATACRASRERRPRPGPSG